MVLQEITLSLCAFTDVVPVAQWFEYYNIHHAVCRPGFASWSNHTRRLADRVFLLVNERVARGVKFPPGVMQKKLFSVEQEWNF